jgi:hypothetical protein
MALQSFTITVGAQVDVNGKNYVAGQVVYIKKLNGTLASIYSDLGGLSPIPQDGFSNVTNVDGQFTFYVEAGEYNAESGGKVTPITVVGSDYFNSKINEVVLELSKSRGFRVVGDFASGFTYELPNDVGVDGSGNYWIYTDVNALPVVVSAGTTPSAPTYTQVTFNDAIGVSYSENGNVDAALRKRAGYYTLSEAQSANLDVGQVVNITDYNLAKYTVVDVSDLGGVYLPKDSNLKFKLLVKNKTVNLESLTTSSGDAYQAINDIQSSNEVETISISSNFTVSQNITITKNITFNDGGLLTPSTGVTVTFKTTPFSNSNGYRIFDTSSGGSFAIDSENEINEIHVYWFGVTPYSSAEADARTNMKSIADALAMAGSLGIGVQAIGRAPIVRLPRLNFYVDAPTPGSGLGALIESYVRLAGYGDNTYMQIRPGADAFDVFRIASPGANSVVIDNFQIDGNYTQQTNLQNAIVFDVQSSPAIYCEVGGDTLYIKEMNGWGIWIKGAGLNDSIINPKVVRDCARNALYVSACDALRVRGSYRTSKTIYANILFDGTSVYYAVLSNVTSKEAGGANLWISNINSERGRVVMNGGSLEAAGTSGAILDRAYKSSLNDVEVFRNGHHGVDLLSCNKTSIKGGSVDFNKRRGLNISNCNDCLFGGGLTMDSNSDTNTNVYDAIAVFTSDNNQFGEVMIRNTNNTQRYGLVIDDAASDNNIISSLVDARNSGNTGSISDAGTGTIGVKKTVSGTQTVSVPSFGSFTFTITDASVTARDTVQNILSGQLDTLIYTGTTRSGSVDVFLFNNTNAAISITNLNISVDLISK